MVETLPTWQAFDSRRNGFFQPVVAWTLIGAMVGTGGIFISPAQIPKSHGTGSAVPVTPGLTTLALEQGLAVELQLIREALRLSVAETAMLFGVKRPTIYNWQNGKPISPENAERLREIAHALEPHLHVIQAQVGRVAHRAIEGRNTLLQMLAQGANAQEAIGRLAIILGREAAQHERLARQLQGRTSNRGAADLDSLG